MKYYMCRSLFCVLCLFAFIAPVCAQDNVIDEVVWIVGDEAILKSDVENARIDAQISGQRWEGDPYCVIPEQLAVQKLFLNQASLDSITISDSEVLQKVELKMDYFIQQIGSKEKMEEYFGKTSYQIREQLFEMTKNEELVNRVRMDIVSSIKVTPAMVRKYFKGMPDDSIPFVPTKVEVQILVREPVIKQEEIDRVKEELRNYTERVNSGKQQFSTLALMYSEDMLTAARGGECGLTYRAEFVPEFANVAFNLTDTKTVSKIVETEYGFHILQLIEKVGDRVNVRHILKKPRVSDEEINNCVHFLDSVSDELRRGLYKFEECVPFLSHDKDTRNNYGLMFDAVSASSKFEMKDLPAEVAKAVAGLKIGEISAPFTMMNKNGKQVVAVVKLKNRTEGHTATMTDDYQLLQSVVHDKLSMDKIEDWIREKQKTIYVRINEGWQDCEFKYPGWIK